jgi:hypothetical protein
MGVIAAGTLTQHTAEARDPSRTVPPDVCPAAGSATRQQPNQAPAAWLRFAGQLARRPAHAITACVTP